MRQRKYKHTCGYGWRYVIGCCWVRLDVDVVGCGWLLVVHGSWCMTVLNAVDGAVVGYFLGVVGC